MLGGTDVVYCGSVWLESYGTCLGDRLYIIYMYMYCEFYNKVASSVQFQLEQLI